MYKKYFNGKNAIITGAASGIGKSFAIALAKRGTNLLISDINHERLEETRKKLESFGIKVFAIKCDVTNHTDIKEMVKTAIIEMGDIHFVFSNAGMHMVGPFEFVATSSWKQIIDINLWGMINVVKEFIPYLLKQGFGHIIVTSSISGSMGIGGQIPYTTTKFSNAGFCEALYGEFAHRGLDVSIICPFPLQTNLIETVGLSFPPELLEGLSQENINQGIAQGKHSYWSELCKKQPIWRGFGGGFPVDRAIKRYMKKIRKKKLYIFERRYGRLLQFLRGFWPRMYKKFVKSIGKRHIRLIHETYEIALKNVAFRNEKLLIKNGK